MDKLSTSELSTMLDDTKRDIRTFDVRRSMLISFIGANHGFIKLQHCGEVLHRTHAGEQIANDMMRAGFLSAASQLHQAIQQLVANGMSITTKDNIYTDKYDIDYSLDDMFAYPDWFIGIGKTHDINMCPPQARDTYGASEDKEDKEGDS